MTPLNLLQFIRIMFGRIAGVLISGLILLDYVLGEEIEIAGCGGFVQSPHPLDFNQIEIKLYVKKSFFHLLIGNS